MWEMSDNDIRPIRHAVVDFHNPCNDLPKADEPILLAVRYSANKVIYTIAHYNRLLDGYMLHNIADVSLVKTENKLLLGWAYLSDFDSIALYND